MPQDRIVVSQQATKAPAGVADRHPEAQFEHPESLGWSSYFEDQLTGEEATLSRLRIGEVHRGRLNALTTAGQIDVLLPANSNTADFAVGDWVLAEPFTYLLHRRLDRKTLLKRAGEGRRPTQLVAANVDTLFIVASCNEDFNLARLERYLALANDAGTAPVIVLTKADVATNTGDFAQQASTLQRGLPVVTINTRSADAAAALHFWCDAGSTVALVGSSGVGKSTLVNTLVGISRSQPQQTGSVREGDSKGRHITTARSLHAMAGGGWVIDTPGMRSLHLKDLAQGLDILFAEVTEFAQRCKFRNCSHDHEPGCAVLAAVAAGGIDPDRLARWRKLQTESRGGQR
jgi:ribosome biogenesis GTPase